MAVEARAAARTGRGTYGAGHARAAARTGRGTHGLRAPEKAAETALVTSRPTVRPGDEEIDRLVRMI
ncbi:hypothetical protein, partial [Streptomyces sp. NPDC003730]